MSYVLDTDTGPRLGMIVLSTDETLEAETRAVLGDRPVRLFHSRIESAPQVTPDSLRAMQALMPESARLLPADLQALAYGCTSASVMIGPDAVAAEMQKVQPGIPVTNPISAVVAALEALGAGRIGLVTPYTREVAGPMRAFLAERGIETVHEVSFGEGDDRRVARISEASTLDAIRQAAGGGDVQAVFASCTNLRTFGVIEAAEAELGLPVISSNLAMLWHLLRLAGIDATGWGPGRLFREHAGMLAA